jgi:hypothetical protein
LFVYRLLFRNVLHEKICAGGPKRFTQRQDPVGGKLSIDIYFLWFIFFVFSKLIWLFCVRVCLLLNQSMLYVVCVAI